MCKSTSTVLVVHLARSFFFGNKEKQPLWTIAERGLKVHAWRPATNQYGIQYL